MTKTNAHRGGIAGGATVWFHVAPCLLIAVLIALSYLGTLGHSFHFDDLTQIVGGREIQDLQNLPGLIGRPRFISLVTFAFNYSVGGLDPAGYHVVNIAIHALASILAYLVAYHMFLSSGKGGKPTARVLALLCALVFALHPVQTQAVTYIVQRMESLSTLFYLAGIFFFAIAPARSSRRARFVFYALVPMSYALGFYSKEMSVTLPAALFLYDLFFVAKGDLKGIGARWLLHGVMLVMLAVFLFISLGQLGGPSTAVSAPTGGKAGEVAPVDKALTTAINKSDTPTAQLADKPDPASYVERVSGAGFSVVGITPKEYLFTQMNVIVYYMALLVVPVNQNLDYDFPVSRSLFEAPEIALGAVLNIPIFPPIVSLLIIAVILAIAIYLSIAPSLSGWRPAGYSVFLFFIALSPTSSFIPIIDVIYEHRLYLPVFGYSIVLVSVAYAIFARLFCRVPRL